jgi:hypothetical protein
LLRVTFCLAGEQVRRGDQGEGVGISQEGFGLVGVVEDLDGREADADFAAE